MGKLRFELANFKKKKNWLSTCNIGNVSLYDLSVKKTHAGTRKIGHCVYLLSRV